MSLDAKRGGVRSHRGGQRRGESQVEMYRAVLGRNISAF